MKKFEVVAMKYDVVKRQTVEYVAGTFDSVSNAMLFKYVYERKLQSECSVRERNIDEEKYTFTRKQIIDSLNAKYSRYINLSANLSDNDEYLDGVYDGRMRTILDCITLINMKED